MLPFHKGSTKKRNKPRDNIVTQGMCSGKPHLHTGQPAG